MSKTSTLLRVPELSEPIHPEIAEAESPPSQSSRTSLRTDDKASPGSSHRGSRDSNDDGVNGLSIPYADNTNTESTEFNAYDHARKRSASTTSHPSQSQGRSRGSYDMHRMSQDGGNRWADDKEAKQKKLLRRMLDHKLAPSFLQ
ncbi:hypothetical protein CERZMDRAFT_91607 [Cercospora zeae-maydis SCOH1-5]|uniref:Uncharacterized protein n=1 Tax=Cercospora zeae-maydis SCOH1-5 TaxID=717836 RepID=A0A6A6F3F2_9PEZI|nr:hypothetical protein CERZMDRAFT_91607 [Cercospora zeae-maydis SCOH1-5]